MVSMTQKIFSHGMCHVVPRHFRYQSLTLLPINGFNFYNINGMKNKLLKFLFMHDVCVVVRQSTSNHFVLLTKFLASRDYWFIAEYSSNITMKNLWMQSRVASPFIRHIQNFLNPL